MYSMVLMAALTTGIDMPDRGRRGGCCGGCYGGCYGGWGGCYGGCGGGCYGMGYGGGFGGARMSWGGWGNGYSGYALGNYSRYYSGYAYSPMTFNWGTPIVSAGGTMFNPAGLSQSFYFNPAGTNEATLIVHMPANASLSIDGQQTQQRSDTRVFTTPPLEPGKTYTYTLRAEMTRDGRTVHETKNVDVRAGQPSEVTMNPGGSIRSEQINPPAERTPAVPPEQ